jgi:predicted XRE-type DNA-binding protein
MAAITVHTTAAIPITDGTTVTAITALPARVFPTGERSRLIERVPFSTNGREMKPAILSEMTRVGNPTMRKKGHTMKNTRDVFDRWSVAQAVFPFECRCMQMMEIQKAQDAEIDKLVAIMDAATGEQRVDAMVAVINKLVEQRKAMQAEMAAHLDR